MKYLDIEAYYQVNWKKLLYTWHISRKMSSYEIAETIKKDTGIVYTYRSIELWLVKFGFMRKFKAALRNRVFMGRMDYSRRKTDYKKRFIDYELRAQKLGYLWAIGLKRLLRKRGASAKLAKALNISNKQVSNWQNLRNRVSPRRQNLIAAYFGVGLKKIFLGTKTHRIYKRKIVWRPPIKQKERLTQRGYRCTTNLKSLMYKKRITITNLAKKLKKPCSSISRWINQKTLISPKDQHDIERILNITSDKAFAYPEPEVRSQVSNVLSIILSNERMTQAQFAKRLGVSRATVSNWFRRKRIPSMTQRKKICLLFNISEGELFGGGRTLYELR